VRSSIGRAAFAGALALAALSTVGCGKQIGDSCQTASDCDPNGNRICDLSQPGGYCTELGCNETTCPSEAVCVRNFPAQFLTKPCNPACEDRVCAADGGSTTGVDAGVTACDPSCPGGPTNDCTADETCLDEGLCAPRDSEIRSCEKSCSSSSDCRGGYVCRTTGTEGSEALTTTPGQQVSYCAAAASE
jgi:hypothetical protein